MRLTNWTLVSLAVVALATFAGVRIAGDRLGGAKAAAPSAGVFSMPVPVVAVVKQTLPIYQDQERSWSQLHKEGFAGRLLAEDRKRVRIEAEQELKAQSHVIEGARATISQSKQRSAQLVSNYRQLLYNERVDATAQFEKADQDAQKQAIRQELDHNEINPGPGRPELIAEVNRARLASRT